MNSVALKARAEWKLAEQKVQEEEESQTPDQTLLQTLKAKEQELSVEYNTLWMREPGALVHALVKQLKEEPEERSRWTVWFARTAQFLSFLRRHDGVHM